MNRYLIHSGMVNIASDRSGDGRLALQAIRETLEVLAGDFTLAAKAANRVPSNLQSSCASCALAKRQSMNGKSCPRALRLFPDGRRESVTSNAGTLANRRGISDWRSEQPNQMQDPNPVHLAIQTLVYRGPPLTPAECLASTPRCHVDVRQPGGPGRCALLAAIAACAVRALSHTVRSSAGALHGLSCVCKDQFLTKGVTT